MLNLLEHFDPVAKRIAKLEADMAGNGDPIFHFDSPCRQPCAPSLKIVDRVGHVGFRGTSIDTVFDAHVNLPVADGQPEPAPLLQ